MEKKERKTFDSKEFKELQMEWYRKLDKEGFKDIERVGPNRGKLYDEYSPYLDGRSFHNLTKRRAFSAETAQLLGKFSFHKGFLTKIYAFADQNDIVIPDDIRKIKRLRRSDHTIVKKAADGFTIDEISKYLRDNYKPEPALSVGKPLSTYSTFYVSTRLRKLIKIARVWAAYECHCDAAEEIAQNAPHIRELHNSLDAWGVQKTRLSDEA